MWAELSRSSRPDCLFLIASLFRAAYFDRRKGNARGFVAFGLRQAGSMIRLANLINPNIFATTTERTWWYDEAHKRGDLFSPLKQKGGRRDHDAGLRAVGFIPRDAAIIQPG